MEKALETMLERISSNTDTRNEVFDLCSNYLKSSQEMPPELELRFLQYKIEDNPEDSEIKKRMVAIYNIMGQIPPAWLEAELASQYVSDEYARDFQKHMHDWGEKSEYKDMDAAFFPLFEQCRQYTMTSVERLYALWNSVNYIAKKTISGDVVEVGVWRGGSMMLSALTLLNANDMRELWLYDTFAGLPKPDEKLDINLKGIRAIDAWNPRSFDGKTSYWCYSTEEETRSNMLKTGYPENRLHFIKGMVEETMPRNLPDKIAILRLDTDFYSSYKHVLTHAWDRIMPGGICILDDYGHFNGARIATEEFLKERNLCVLMHRPDYSSRVFVKEK